MQSTMPSNIDNAPTALVLSHARLPRWLLPEGWPQQAGEPQRAQLRIENGRITQVLAQPATCNGIDLHGTLVLPGLIEAHAHLDKTFTRQRLGPIEPGLLGAIAATQLDRRQWTRDDLHQRSQRALRQAASHGVSLLRSHVDWWSAAAPPAWSLLADLAQDSPVELQRVALVPLPLFANKSDATLIARQVQQYGGVLGAFIHTSNDNDAALRQLLDVATHHGLDLDLHVDEELSPHANGLARVAQYAQAIGFAGRIVCSHACALAAQPAEVASHTLDSVARAPITLLALPSTNLMLQDAVAGRTPRQRGLTLIKEARERGIPLLLGTDNVQDAFCPTGRYDPVQTLQLAVLTGQLADAFDQASQAICRRDWLATPQARPTLIGAPAELTLFHSHSAFTWPADPERSLLRGHHLPDAFLAHLRSLT